jgi:riboflavin kinase / FMN adenylyltransferase
MKVIFGRGNLDKGPRGPKALAIGVFDGVHRGHKKILRTLCHIARSRRMPSAVVTFETHPARALPRQEHVLHLTSLEHKLLFLEREGIDICYVIDFTPAFARIEPEVFVKEILVKKMQMRALVVGEDFVFGRHASGDVALLRVLSQTLGFFFKSIRLSKIRGKVISSTSIRRLIATGHIALARVLLGRHVSLFGDVVPGEGRGRTLGFPTANVKARHEVIVSDGIYAARVLCRGRWHNGIAYVGTKPTFSKGSAPRSIEVHIFGFKKNIYGHSLEIEFIKRIRADRKFPDAASLVAQMEKDALVAKRFLKRFS